MTYCCVKQSYTKLRKVNQQHRPSKNTDHRQLSTTQLQTTFSNITIAHEWLLLCFLLFLPVCNIVTQSCATNTLITNQTFQTNSNFLHYYNIRACNDQLYFFRFHLTKYLDSQLVWPNKTSQRFTELYKLLKLEQTMIWLHVV